MKSQLVANNIVYYHPFLIMKSFKNRYAAAMSPIATSYAMDS